MLVLGGKALSLIGKDGGQLENLTDNYIIPFYSTSLIQELQFLIGHSICDELEKYIVRNPKMIKTKNNLFLLSNRYYLVTGAAVA